MAERTGWRGAVEPWLRLGEIPSETETQRGGRRVLLVAIYIGTLLSVPTAFADLDAGYTRVAAMTLVTTVVTVALGVAVWRWPRRLFLCVQLLAAGVYVSQHGEPHGIVGRARCDQITRDTYELIRHAFVCEPRGPVQVKGKATMETFLLVSRRGSIGP